MKNPLYLADQNCIDCQHRHIRYQVDNHFRPAVTAILETAIDQAEDDGMRKAYEIFRDTYKRCDHTPEHPTINQTLGMLLSGILTPEKDPRRLLH